jgi:AAA domain/Bifunctional DNA primase/polymerase, N-terminal
MTTKTTSQTSLKADQTTSNCLTQTINWLFAHNYPALPVAPHQDPRKYHKIDKAYPERNLGSRCPLTDTLAPIPLYTGKNPSYLDQNGKPHLVNHKQYQNRLPSEQELTLWFTNPNNGIGTLGGWNNTIWLDFDLKQFTSATDCEDAVIDVIEKVVEQTRKEPFLEKSHSGGWRVGVKVQEKPTFTNFCLTNGGTHIGEALGEGRFTVLAPTIGPSGNPYESIHQTEPPLVTSLESIGIYSTKTQIPPTNQNPSLLPTMEVLPGTTPPSQLHPSNTEVVPGTTPPTKQNPSPTLVTELIPNTIPLEQLGNKTSQEILTGTDTKGDRSDSLTTALREWYGWQNWCDTNDVKITGTAEELAHYAGEKLGIDSARIDRIVKSIGDPSSCAPATQTRGGDEACWKKIHHLDKGTFQTKCPTHIKDSLKQAYQSNATESSQHIPQSSATESSQGDTSIGHSHRQSPQPTTPKLPIREAVAIAESILRSNPDPLEANILLEELRGETGMSAWEWNNKYLKQIRAKLEREFALPDAQSGKGILLNVDPYEAKRLELKQIAQEKDALKFIDKIVHFCRSTGWKRSDVEQQIRLFKVGTTTPTAERCKGQEFLALETESISWVFPGIIPSRGVFVIGGDAGVGKTTIAYDAAGSLLLGEEFLGEKPVNKGKVLLVTGDELPCFTQDKLIDRGFPVDNDDWEIILNWDIAQWNVLEEAVADIKPALVVIDSFSSIHRDPSFDENSSQAKNTIYDLESLSNSYGFGCILIHHLSKSKDNKGVGKLRGSSAIAAAASVVCIMEKGTSEDTRKLSFPKMRGAQTEPFTVTLDGSSGRFEVMIGGDAPSTKSLGERILAFLKKSPHKRFEQCEISLALGIPECNKDSVYQALGRLFKRGLITKRPSTLGGKRKVYGIANPTDTPPHNPPKLTNTPQYHPPNSPNTPQITIQETLPLSSVKMSVKIAETIEIHSLEATDSELTLSPEVTNIELTLSPEVTDIEPTLSPEVTDIELTAQTKMPDGDASNPDTVIVSAKLTDTLDLGGVSPVEDLLVDAITSPDGGTPLVASATSATSHSLLPTSHNEVMNERVQTTQENSAPQDIVATESQVESRSVSVGDRVEVQSGGKYDGQCATVVGFEQEGDSVVIVVQIDGDNSNFWFKPEYLIYLG